MYEVYIKAQTFACGMVSATCFIFYMTPFEVLGLDSNATITNIRAAYKRLALQLHPDRNKAPDACTQFHAVTEAYNVLCRAARTPTAAPPAQRRGPPTAFDGPIPMDVDVDLEDLYNGFTRSTTIVTHLMVNGRLTAMLRRFDIDGTKCRSPDDTFCIPTSSTGAQHNFMVRLQIRPHAVYTRAEFNLHTTVMVGHVDSLCGFTLQLRSLSGRDLTHVLAHVAPGSEHRFLNEGLQIPGSSRRGAIVVGFVVHPVAIARCDTIDWVSIPMC